jgi:hypothetical protein
LRRAATKTKILIDVRLLADEYVHKLHYRFGLIPGLSDSESMPVPKCLTRRKRGAAH